MNKLLKGSIAGAAGIALLLGGAGTFALWNDSAAASGGTVQSGALTITKTAGTEAWADASADKTSTTWRAVAVGTPGQSGYIPADSLVPGDTVTYTQQFAIAANGKNLKANLSFDETTYVVADALKPYVKVTMSAKVNGTGTATVASTATANNFLVTPTSNGTTNVDVTFTVAFDKLATEKVGQSTAQAVKMTDLGVKLIQVRP